RDRVRGRHRAAASLRTGSGPRRSRVRTCTWCDRLAPLLRRRRQLLLSDARHHPRRRWTARRRRSGGVRRAGRRRVRVGTMTTRVVILGGGTGGTLTANRLRRRFASADMTITVVDQDDRHVYQPGLLFVPFGLAHIEDIVRPRRRQLHRGVEFVQSPIDGVDIDAQRVRLENGTTLDYDVLVVASGATLVPEETEGLTGAGWMDSVFTFYTPEGAAALEAALATFDGGRIVVNVVDMPIKCPVAPLEFCFLADWYFHERGIRDAVQLTYVTPLDGAFTKPVASAQLGGMLADRGIELVTEFNTGEVDGSCRTTNARCPSISPSSCRCTVARHTSVGPPVSATTCTSCPRTSTRCSQRLLPTSS